MIRTLFVLLTLVSSGALFAQQIRVPIKASLFAGSTKTFNFTFAADPAGTDTVDLELGEVEIPSLPLPGDIFYVWTIAPTEEVLWISPMEVRRYAVGVSSLVVYDVRVNWSGGRLEMAWDNFLPPEIDSMYVVDGYTEFPDNVLSVKVGPDTKLETNNPAFERFKVMIWFNGTTTSVSEQHGESQVRLFPNPAAETITIDGLSFPESPIELVNHIGQVVYTGSTMSTSATLNVGRLPAGMYMVRVSEPTGVRSIPFIRR